MATGELSTNRGQADRSASDSRMSNAQLLGVYLLMSVIVQEWVQSGDIPFPIMGAIIGVLAGIGGADRGESAARRGAAAGAIFLACTAATRSIIDVMRHGDGAILSGVVMTAGGAILGHRWGLWWGTLGGGIWRVLFRRTPAAADAPASAAPGQTSATSAAPFSTSGDEHARGPSGTVTGSAATLNEATARAMAEVPWQARVVEQTVISSPQSRTLRNAAYLEERARAVMSTSLAAGEQLQDVRLVTPAKRRFGLVTSPAIYEGEAVSPAVVRLVYSASEKERTTES